jgi:predicted metal-dependent enzyme (double-stranded beta helix superfamily)
MNLEEFCPRLHALLEQDFAVPALLEKGRSLVAELVRDPDCFGDVLRRLIHDREFLRAQAPSIYGNEITLHRAPDRSFSVFAYIWEPNSAISIHDHGSWGLVGNMLQPVQERKYRRLDDGRVEGYAELVEISSGRIDPGATTSVLPLDEGIHDMGTVGERGAVTINVYGRSIRKGFIHIFNPAQKKVFRAYPPPVYKQVLALRSLGLLPEAKAQEILAAGTLPEFLRRELIRPASSPDQPDPH